MADASLYLDGELVGELTSFEYTIDGRTVRSPGVASIYENAIARADTAITEAIRGQSVTTEPSSLSSALVAHDIQARAFAQATFECEFTFTPDDAFKDWLASFSRSRLPRRERQKLNNWRRSIRRQLVRLAGAHDRWAHGPFRGDGFAHGRYLCGASVPRSMR